MPRRLAVIGLDPRTGVYVFGVAALVTLCVVSAFGPAIALGGTDWWHTTPVGHFLNSVHMCSVEVSMAFTVIYLWGKFWMGGLGHCGEVDESSLASDPH